jgi:hypothetical protein
MTADLKDEIKGRVQFFSNDCSTFWRVRLQQNKWFHRWKLGGGNFVIALATFSALNFLAKVYAFVFKPKAFHRTKSGEWRINETDAFNWMIDALLKDGIDLGIPLNEATAIWNHFRNKLAHIAKPGSFVGVYDFKKSVSSSAAEKAVRTGKPSFFKHSNGHWMCNADRLSLDILRVADWVCEKVDACTDQGALQQLSDWMSQT